MTRYRSNKEVKFIPQEQIIPLLEPVRIYTALELAAMPLSQMNAAIEAQENYYFLEHSTQMGGGSDRSTPCITVWEKVNTGCREIQNTLPHRTRIHRASHYSPIGKAWAGEAGRVVA